MRLILIFTVTMGLTACADFPDLDAAISDDARNADYPALVPAEGILARGEAGTLTESSGPALQARAANLRARAALLRGIAIDEETRLRLAVRLKRLGG